MKPDVAGKLYWVVGLARSGCAAGALLRRHGAFVIGVDDAAEDAVKIRWGREGLSNLAPQAFDQLATGGDWPSAAPHAVVISPGVPPAHLRLQALPADIPVMGEMELAARFCAADIVAITGTNGKSTTTELIAHLVRRCGRQAAALGNLGTPLSQVVEELPADAVVSLEVSSFQLETVHQFRPRVGLVLNLAPDHLDRYPDLAAYYNAKKTLAGLIKPDGWFITWTGCSEARSWPTAGQRLLFGGEEDGAAAFYRDGNLMVRVGDREQVLLSVADLALQSPPNLLNALAGAAVGLALGLDPAGMAQGLRDFPGLAHRHQLVATKDRVRFINDTKATNVHAVCAGLQGYPHPVVLIAGGSGKGEDYSPLRDVMGAVRHVVLIGQEGPAIGKALCDLVPTSAAASMEEALAQAMEVVRLMDEPDPVVLLSPACASYDMFANYRKRGEAFTAAAISCGATLNRDANLSTEG